MPSGQASRAAPATSAASRLLPAPPVPVSVTSRAFRTSALSARNSASRPTKLVRRRGRLVGAAFVGWPWPATLPIRVSSPRPAAMQRPGGKAKRREGRPGPSLQSDAPWGSGGAASSVLSKLPVPTGGLVVGFGRLTLRVGLEDGGAWRQGGGGAVGCCRAGAAGA